MIMTKIIIPFFALACLLGGVSAQTTKDGDLRECAGRGWNTCDSWKHCNWRGTKSDGECYNNCPVIGFPDNVGTTRDCQNLEGCHMVGYSTTCDFKSKVVDCSAANNPNWLTTWHQCQAIDGCMFNPIFGKNECIRDWSAAAYVNIQNDRDGDEDEDTQSESSGDVSSEDNDLPSHDSNSTYTSADSSDSDSDSGGYSNSNDMGNSASSNDRDGGRKSYLRQSRL